MQLQLLHAKLNAKLGSPWQRLCGIRIVKHRKNRLQQVNLPLRHLVKSNYLIWSFDDGNEGRCLIERGRIWTLIMFQSTTQHKHSDTKFFLMSHSKIHPLYFILANTTTWTSEQTIRHSKASLLRAIVMPRFHQPFTCARHLFCVFNRVIGVEQV